jgi:hypothetical protein
MARGLGTGILIIVFAQTIIDFDYRTNNPAMTWRDRLLSHSDVFYFFNPILSGFGFLIRL